jgi:hypothetical protein
MAGNYYRPYLNSESDLSDAESADGSLSPPITPRPTNAENDLKSPSLPIPDYTAFAKGLQAPAAAAGPSFVTDEQQQSYGLNKIDRKTGYSSVSFPEASGKITASDASVASVVMLQSVDRDKRIFPQPTVCTLLLPRVYRNVTGFSIAQINLTSAFYYFNSTKSNVDIQIYENNRILYDLKANPTLDSNGNQVPLLLTNRIRNGSYNISDLLGELQTQLNRVPLFYDFLNGFSDFYNIFSVTGDYTLNFNYPGDSYYDSSKQTFIKNPTREIISSYYFQGRYASQYKFTVPQGYIAYYYPVLKEILLDTSISSPSLNLTYQSMSKADVTRYIIYTFQGLDDPIVKTVIMNNIGPLDDYRLLHTFRYSLVNQYTCSYDPANNAVTIGSSNLNTSLSNLLVSQYNSLLSAQLGKYGISADQFNNLALLNLEYLAVTQSMYQLLQNNFAQFFAVNFGTFDNTYFLNTSNTVLLKNGLDASGVFFNYNIGNPNPLYTSTITKPFTNPPNYYWNLNNLGRIEGAQRNMGSLKQSYPQSSNYPYSIFASNIDFTRSFIGSNGLLYSDFRRSCGDILVNVEAGKYTIFKFRSNCRQNLQVESLPRQTIYRYPIYNNNNPLLYPLSNLYDVSYSYSIPNPRMLTQLTSAIGFKTLQGWSYANSNFGISYTTSLALITQSESIDITDSNGKTYNFHTPFPTSTNASSNLYKYPINVSIISQQPLIDNYTCFFYQDMSALYADISGIRQENPLHYKSSLTLSPGTTSNVLTFNAYANQQYYVFLRSDTETPVSANFFIVPWFSGSNYSIISPISTFSTLVNPTTQLSNYSFAIAADPDFIRVPISSNLWASNTPLNQPITQINPANLPYIGYDTNGVSTDLTDYIGFKAKFHYSTITPSAAIRCDPTNNFLMKTVDGTNTILTQNGKGIYTPSKVAYRTYKIAQYYATNYIQDSGTIGYSPSDISPYCYPYTAETTSNTDICGYHYDGPGGSLNLRNGVPGFMFLPDDGTWFIQRLMFKTNFVNPRASRNSNIHAMAVFYTSEIDPYPTSFTNLTNALAICLLTSTITYSASSQNLGFDNSYGTYYTFSNYSSLVTRVAPITGYAQSVRDLIPDKNAYYTAVAINFPQYSTWDIKNINISTLKTQLSSATVTTIQNLTGTPIAYPFINKAYTSTTFYDGEVSPTGYGMVLSSPTPSTLTDANKQFAPPQDCDESMSKYEQSIPIVNSHIHFLEKQNIVFDSNAFYSWESPSPCPTNIIASIPNMLLFQDNTFTIARYSTLGNQFGATTVVASNAARFFYGNQPGDGRVLEQIPINSIYTDFENTSLIGVAGNTSSYVFLGAKFMSNSPTAQLRFKQFNPKTGVLTELPINSNYTFNNSFTIKKFLYNDTNSWFILSTDKSGSNSIIQGAMNYGPTMITQNYQNSPVSELEMDPSGSFLYFGRGDSLGFSTINMYSLNQSHPTFIGNNPTGYTINMPLYTASNNPLPATYKKMTVTLTDDKEEVLLTNQDYLQYNFYKIRNYVPTRDSLFSNANIDVSIYMFNHDDKFRVPAKIIGGYGGSKWVTRPDTSFIWGNRNDQMDAPTAYNIAWQIFFPTMKIEMKKISAYKTPLIDFQGLTYPEWPHSMMFLYSNYTSMCADISNNDTGGTWGAESNYMTNDASFNGLYFNSYAAYTPLQANVACNVVDYDNYYYLAIRGYFPTESFQTMLRFYTPGRYDYGYLSLTDLSGECHLATSNTKPQFNPNYYRCVTRFNSSFTFSNQNFGSNAIQALAGMSLSSLGFGDFLRQYTNLFSTFTANVSILANIQSTLKGEMTRFISNDLKYILPADSFLRQRYIDPILFQINWYSQLTPGYVTKDDEWGLGWNLGYSKTNTILGTFQTATSFFKIQQDFIYLQLSPQFNINKMDAGGKENYQVSREPTGTTNQYYCKLLLTSFGGNATTFIHNPITFNPPLNRLTKMDFAWIDSHGIPINNFDSEWDMTVSISENSSSPSIEKEPLYLPGGKTKEEEIKGPAPAPTAQADSDKAAKEEAEKSAKLYSTISNM